MTIAEKFDQEILAANGDREMLKTVFNRMINEAVGGLVLLSDTGTGVQYPPFGDPKRPIPHFEFRDKSRYEFNPAQPA
jgi:hypothetical protein